MVNVVDTTGAADIFGGAALWKLLQLNDAAQASFEELRQTVEFASIAAGLSVQKLGGIQSIPAKSDILQKNSL